MAKPIRILIADDHAIVREGQRALIETEPGMELVGEAADGVEAVEVRLRHEKIHCDDCGEPGRPGSKIDHFEREISLEGQLDDEQRRRMLQIADRCPVHRTIEGGAKVTTALADPDS